MSLAVQVSKLPVAEELAAQQRRIAFNTMLDPRELHDTHLDANEIAAVSSFLAANVEERVRRRLTLPCAAFSLPAAFVRALSHRPAAAQSREHFFGHSAHEP